MAIKLHFYGGARSVTGANYLVETDQAKILVDCGMFQGVKHAEERNYEDFPYDPKEIDAVFVTHGHADHVGRIPKLYREGFNKSVYSTPPTRDLMELNLRDSVEIIRREAERDDHPPLYEEKDIASCIHGLCMGQPYGDMFDVAPGIRARLRDAGHILGSSIIELWVQDKGGKARKIVFSGDLGNPPVPLLNSTEFIDDADYVVIESTYGDRVHEDRPKRKAKLERVIRDTVMRKGVLLIPAFAIERTQELLFELNNLFKKEQFPHVPVFLDAPLAIRVTDVYRTYKGTPYMSEGIKEATERGETPFVFKGLTFTPSVEESKAINNVAPPKIIIAGSGMSTGGRILHHERRYLLDQKNTILFIGFQAAGTLGRRIFDGDRDVRIFDDIIPVRSSVEAIGGYSAHADKIQLLSWIQHFKIRPQHVFAVQGEEGPALHLAESITEQLGIKASAPMVGDVIEL